jgi:hypothetical protein
VSLGLGLELADANVVGVDLLLRRFLLAQHLPHLRLQLCDLFNLIAAAVL